jgi:hypothetical protein
MVEEAMVTSLECTISIRNVQLLGKRQEVNKIESMPSKCSSAKYEVCQLVNLMISIIRILIEYLKK